jgi:hypothetical protein
LSIVGELTVGGSIDARHRDEVIGQGQFRLKRKTLQVLRLVGLMPDQRDGRQAETARMEKYLADMTVRTK